jgi:hypothetical protein
MKANMNIPLIRQKERLIAAIRKLSFCPREPLDRMNVAELTALLDHLAVNPQRKVRP